MILYSFKIRKDIYEKMNMLEICEMSKYLVDAFKPDGSYRVLEQETTHIEFFRK